MRRSVLLAPFNSARLGLAVLLLASALLWACNERSFSAAHRMPSASVEHVFDQSVNNDIDILFMVDDSPSMDSVQANLVRNFTTFISVLKMLPNGLPNVHIGVVSSNMGAGKFSALVPGCERPDYGQLVAQARAPIMPASTTCQANKIAGSARYIEALGNGQTRNFTGDIETVFGCMAQVGTQGCGFEAQLASTEAALGPNAPMTNRGFLRPDAFLAVIYITNEDDCSIPLDSELIDTGSTRISDPLGPLTSFRCTEYGILCGGKRPPRAATGNLGNCVSNEMGFTDDRLHALVPVQHYIDFFRALKPVPNRVIVAGIAAPPTPFQVAVDPQGNPGLNISCSSGNGTGGDPAVRLKQFVDAFANTQPSRGTFTSICQDSYAGAMQIIAELIGRSLGRQCMEGIVASAPSHFTRPLADTDFTHGGKVVIPSHVSCTVEDVQYAGTAQQKALGAVQACNPDGQQQGPCWALVSEPTCQVGKLTMQVCRNGFSPDATKGGQPKPCLDGTASAPDGTSAVVHCVGVPPPEMADGGI